MIILDSARKHGISDEDIRFVYDNAVNSIVLEEFPLKIMLLGFSSTGKALEIGYFVNESGNAIIMHAMKLRKVYQKYLNG